MSCIVSSGMISNGSDKVIIVIFVFVLFCFLMLIRCVGSNISIVI